MKNLKTGQEMILRKKKSALSFRKEKFEVVFHYYKSEDNDEIFTNKQIDELNLNQVHNQYRLKYNLPFPDEIKMIREKYGLSASKMSGILGFGTNGYRNYEVGEVPSLSNSRLIQMANDPKEFMKLIELSGSFNGKSLEKISKKIDEVITQEKANLFKTQLEQYFLGTLNPNAFTGYRRPNFDKFKEMVVFFTERMQPWKAKLNKLLFYADFGMYSKVGLSISGIQYQAIQMGPAPNNFQSIFEYLSQNKDIDIHFTTYRTSSIGEQFIPNAYRSFRPEIFSERELNELEEIAERFNNCATDRIINISHMEKAWIENERDRKMIDYNYAFNLNKTGLFG